MVMRSSQMPRIIMESLEPRHITAEPNGRSRKRRSTTGMIFGISKDADGETSPFLAKSTRVYAKQGGKWMLVHANFAPVGDED